jgi:hypothetical protein
LLNSEEEQGLMILTTSLPSWTGEHL